MCLISYIMSICRKFQLDLGLGKEIDMRIHADTGIAYFCRENWKYTFMTSGVVLEVFLMSDR